MLLPTALRLAVTESLLPKGTVQLGPRNFIKKKFTDYKNGKGKQKHTRVYIYISFPDAEKFSIIYKISVKVLLFFSTSS